LDIPIGFFGENDDYDGGKQQESELFYLIHNYFDELYI
jgi:hypothetical protein